MKNNQERKHLWLMTGIYWIVGIMGLFWGRLDQLFAYQIKNINSIYTFVLLIILLIPLLISLSSFIFKPPHFICNPLMALLYLLIVISAGLAYNLQDVLGYIFLLIIFIIVAIGTVFYALFKTFMHKRNNKYYFVDSENKEECSNFWDTFKKYYLYGITRGILESILTVIFSWNWNKQVISTFL